MLIDCSTCTAPAGACDDCVVSFLLDRPAADPGVTVDDAEHEALATLARAGLVPPLRLQPVVGVPEPGPEAIERRRRPGSTGSVRGIA